MELFGLTFLKQKMKKGVVGCGSLVMARLGRVFGEAMRL
jgi:hypothetical protein